MRLFSFGLHDHQIHHGIFRRLKRHNSDMASQISSSEDPFHLPENATLVPVSMRAYLREAGGASIPLTALDDKGSLCRCLVVGRQAASVDIHISHPSISRKHAALFFLNDKGDQSSSSVLYLVDGPGKYGTILNGERIPTGQPHRLNDDDTIIFGNVKERVFTVKIEALMSEPVGEKTTVTAAPGDRLDGRAKREAEIAAMIDSLDQVPVYQEHSEPPASSATQEPDADEMTHLVSLAEQYKLPIHQLVIDSESNRRSTVTCIAIDPAGSRFVVGSTDTHLRFYDFGGMARNRTTSFQTVVPQEGQPIVSGAYSNTGDRILVGTASVQPVILDRDGNQVIQFMRGDMYVVDQAKTVGHTFGVTAVDWHPLERDWVLSASQDGTARLWNIQGKTQFDMLVCDKVFQAKSAKGVRTAVTSLCFHPSGREFALGTACGSIQIWSHARVSNRPERVAHDAHGEKKAVTSLVFNADGSHVGSRSISDDAVKIWDQRRLSRSSLPLIVCESLASIHDPANFAFSPDGKVLCGGESLLREKGEEVGRLHFYDISITCQKSHKLSPVFSVDFDRGTSPVTVKWHAKLKQIFVGCSDGKVAIFYDPIFSKKGALLVSVKQGIQADSLSSILQARADASGGVSGQVITPFSLPMYREDRTSENKRKRQDRKDPGKSKEPERPASGKHKTGGQEGSNVTFAQFVADRRVAKSKAVAGTDPREAILRFGDGTERAPELNEQEDGEST